MQVRDQAARGRYLAGLNELFRGFKAAGLIAERSNQLLEPSAGPSIVVDDADHRKRGQISISQGDLVSGIIALFAMQSPITKHIADYILVDVPPVSRVQPAAPR